MCVREVQETLVFNVGYFERHFCDLTNLLIFRKVYIDSAEVGKSDIKRAARVDVYVALSRQACMVSDNVLTGNYLY